VEKKGPVRDKTHANIVLGTRLGSFQISLQFCWPSPKGVLRTWYSFATMLIVCEVERILGVYEDSYQSNFRLLSARFPYWSQFIIKQEPRPRGGANARHVAGGGSGTCTQVPRADPGGVSQVHRARFVGS